jgi:Recombination endonuclease VII
MTESTTASKRCRGHGHEAHIAPRTEFAGNKAQGDGLQKLCRACHSAVMKDFRAKIKTIPLEIRVGRNLSGMKRCARCVLAGRPGLRPIQDFNSSNLERDGKRPHCKDCVRELRWKHSGIVGMTIERYGAMLIQQNHRCAIPSCQTRSKRALDVDHNHDTGEVRGLLCRNCNIIAGQARDSVVILRDIVVYLASDAAVLR